MKFYEGSIFTMPDGGTVVLDGSSKPELMMMMIRNATAVNHRFAGRGLTPQHIANRLAFNQPYNARLLDFRLTRKSETAPVYKTLDEKFGGCYSYIPGTLRFQLNEEYPFMTVQGMPGEHPLTDVLVKLADAADLLNRLNEPLTFLGLEVNTAKTTKVGDVIGRTDQLVRILETYLEWHAAYEKREKATYKAYVNPLSAEGYASMLRMDVRQVLDAVQAITREKYTGKKKPVHSYGAPTASTLLKASVRDELVKRFGVPQSK